MFEGDTDLKCERCGNAVVRLRSAQRYCSKACRQAHFVRRKRSVDIPAPATILPEKRLPALDGATTVPTAALQGKPKSYQEYKASLLPEGSYRSLEAEALGLDANGYPELPSFLDRRKSPSTMEQAA